MLVCQGALVGMRTGGSGSQLGDMPIFNKAGRLIGPFGRRRLRFHVWINMSVAHQIPPPHSSPRFRDAKKIAYSKDDGNILESQEREQKTRRSASLNHKTLGWKFRRQLRNANARCFRLYLRVAAERAVLAIAFAPEFERLPGILDWHRRYCRGPCAAALRRSRHR